MPGTPQLPNSDGFRRDWGVAWSGDRAAAGVCALRRKETLLAAEALGVSRVDFLDYLDSGLEGHPGNQAPGAFCQADPDEVAERVRAVVEEEAASALVIYDEGGI
ncbi:MAG: PIG-L deacetylase family protein [Acidimicrobiia bacterium]